MAKTRKRWHIRARGNSWQVDFGKVDGRREQRSFKTKAEAEQWANAKQRELDDNRFGAFELSDKHRVDALQAYQQLAARFDTSVSQLPTPTLSLTEVTRAYLELAAPEGGQRTVGEVAEEYLGAKLASGRRPRTIQDIRTRMNQITKAFADAPINLVRTTDLEVWLDKQRYKGITRKNYRTHLVMLFNFAKKRGYTTQNPAEGIETPLLDEKTPAILSVKDCDKLMSAVEEHTPQMIPYFAIALFAGLRPSEAEQLDWSSVNFETKTIKVVPATAKKRRQRFVDMSDNLIAWLLPYGRQTGPIGFSRKQFERARRESGVEWAPDILRHSYGSYHIAIHENAAKTSLQMGHREVDVLFNHYRDLVTRDDAARFWNLTPSVETEVLRMPA